MIEDDEPNLVTSGKSNRIVVDGYPFSIDIFRLETDTTWTLEVVDHNNTSHVWDEQFRSDAEARDVAVGFHAELSRFFHREVSHL